MNALWVSCGEILDFNIRVQYGFPATAAPFQPPPPQKNLLQKVQGSFQSKFSGEGVYWEL